MTNIDKIATRLGLGYTMARYGTFDEIHKQMEVKKLGLYGVVFSDQQERSRFQKDIDDCYMHEDEEQDEAEVCLAPSYRIIGCEYNDGRTCDGCKWLPKQT